MGLSAAGKECRIEVFSDEDGIRLICNTTEESSCPLEHPGELGLDCLGAGSAVPEASVQPPGPPSSPPSRGEVYEGPLLPQNRIAPGTPGAEPGAGNTANRGRVPGKGRTDWIPGKETERRTYAEQVNKGCNARTPPLSGDKKGGIPAAVPDSQTISGARKAGVMLEPTRQNNDVGGQAHPGAEPSAAPNTPTARDSHMVVGADDQRHAEVQRLVDRLNEISMDMYLESGSSCPPPIPILGPEESREFLKDLANFKLTDEQMAFYQEAINRKDRSDGRTVLRRLKHRKQHTVRLGGMIRMPEKSEPPEIDEDSFEADDEMPALALPTVKAEPELQRPVQILERPEDLDEDEDEPVSSVDEGWEQVIDEFETEGLGYVCGLEVFTDEDGDHVATLTLDNVSIDLMLVDFLEILAAFNRVTPKLQSILKS